MDTLSKNAIHTATIIPGLAININILANTVINEAVSTKIILQKTRQTHRKLTGISQIYLSNISVYYIKISNYTMVKIRGNECDKYDSRVNFTVIQARRKNRVRIMNLF